MKITIIGTGYVGLVAGACFASFGLKVTCIDNDENKIILLNHGHIPILENGLEELVKRGIFNKNLFFSTDKSAIDKADVIVIAVGTPSDDNGNADLSYLNEAVRDICEYSKNDKTIIIKSTVPIGTAKILEKTFKKLNPSHKFEIISNPEFLREGSAVYDFLNPDRIIVGTSTLSARTIAEAIYSPFKNTEIPIIFTDNTTAEVIKYVANCYLATRITFINEVADICEKVGADIEEVSIGIGTDKRIGKQYLHAGPGFGGSCFPKDTLAFNFMGHQLNAPSQIVKAVINANNDRKFALAEKVASTLKQNKCSQIAVLGLTFKADTDDIRDSAALVIISKLIEEGFNIKVYDPSHPVSAKKLFENSVKFSETLDDCINNSDGAVIITEWAEFKLMDLSMLKSSLKTDVIYDLRNLFDPKLMKSLGFKYYSIGRNAGIA